MMDVDTNELIADHLMAYVEASVMELTSAEEVVAEPLRSAVNNDKNTMKIAMQRESNLCPHPGCGSVFTSRRNLITHIRSHVSQAEQGRPRVGRLYLPCPRMLLQSSRSIVRQDSLEDYAPSVQATGTPAGTIRLMKMNKIVQVTESDHDSQILVGNEIPSPIPTAY